MLLVSSTGAGARSASTAKVASGPSPYTVGRQLRETEQAMVKAQKRVDQLTEQLARASHAASEHTELTALGTELATARASPYPGVSVTPI